MTVIDPVCGMSIEEKDAVATTLYEGKTYFFCSPSCKAKFDKDPQAFVSPNQPRFQTPRPLPKAGSTPVPCILKYVKPNQVPVRNAVWPWNP